MRLINFLSLLVLLLYASSGMSQVTISENSSVADPSSILDVKSTDKGLLLPRMNAEEIKLIQEPANGLLVYNLDDEKFYAFREGVGKWIQIADGEGELIPEVICDDNVIDTRDGTVYNVVKIGNQCWTVENVNIGTKIDFGQDQSDNMVIEKYCYDNLESNCDIYGGLYQWEEMMNYPPTILTSLQGVCPDGWHVSLDTDWEVLRETLIDLGVFSSDHGGPLKQEGTNLWQMPNRDATNLTGFTALPGGRADNVFSNLNTNAYFWTSSTTNGPNNSFRSYNMSFDSDNLGETIELRDRAFSVRCVQDSN